MTSPRVAIVVVAYESRDDLGACLASIEHHTGPDVETVVVDNASTDGSAELVGSGHPRVALIRLARNQGFGAGCNRGAAATTAPYLLFLNPDAEMTAGAMDALARVLDDDAAVGVAGPRTVNEDGTVQVSFGSALGLRSEWRQRALVRGVRRRDPAALARAEVLSEHPSEPDWVSGSCLLVRRLTFEQVGGFDEAFFLYEEDVDLCVRARAAGWRVRYEPRALVRHRLGRSMARDAAGARLEYHRSHLRYYRKHNGWFATAALRAGLAASALAGLLKAVFRGDQMSRAAHIAALRIAMGSARV